MAADQGRSDSEGSNDEKSSEQQKVGTINRRAPGCWSQTDACVKGG